MIEVRQVQARETWLIRHRVMWPNMPLDYVILENDSDGTHFGLFKNEILVSVISLFIEKGKAQFRKLATEKHEQGKGFASILLNHAIDYSKYKNANLLWCNARLNAVDFYKKFGLLSTKETYIKGGIEFIILKKTLN